jgi:uncharacterized protein (DUF2141 family)
MRSLYAVFLALPLVSAAPTPPPGTLIINVDNVRTANGTVHVDVCPEAKFLNDGCPWKGNAKARVGLTSVIVTGLKPGRYAVQAFLDENGNGEVDRGIFGMPKEGVGFSNDAKIRFGPPKFAEAAFGYDGAGQAIHLNLRYFLGPKGPGAR